MRARRRRINKVNEGRRRGGVDKLLGQRERETETRGGNESRKTEGEESETAVCAW